MMQASPVLREFGPVSSVAPPPHQIAALTDDAYARGLAEGLAQAQAEIDARTAMALEDLNERLAAMAAERDGAAEDAATEAGRALATVVRALCPGLSALGMADRARHLLENELLAAPRPVTIRAMPDIAEALEALDALGAGITVEGDDAMPATRLDLSWPEGGATVDTEALATRIMGLAETLGPESGPVPENDPVEGNSHD